MFLRSSFRLAPEGALLLGELDRDLPRHLTVEFLMQRQVFLCEFVARLKDKSSAWHADGFRGFSPIATDKSLEPAGLR